MYLCVCLAITDSDVKKLMEKENCSLEEAKKKLGICSVCNNTFKEPSEV